jgi:hypothetical protein
MILPLYNKYPRPSPSQRLTATFLSPVLSFVFSEAGLMEDEFVCVCASYAGTGKIGYQKGRG